MKLKRFLASILAMCMILSTMSTVAFAEEVPADEPAVVIDYDAAAEVVAAGAVAKVGNTEYATIDDAIANWTNGATLTLLANVTLSDVITLKSTEHHILNLGTYTMTAASGKNAFVIQACGTGDAERTAITINADATKSLSANGSINFPKFVTRLYFLAIFPSSISVKLATIKIMSAITALPVK